MHPDLIKLLAEDPKAGPRPRTIESVMRRKQGPLTIEVKDPKRRAKGGKRARAERIRRLERAMRRATEENGEKPWGTLIKQQEMETVETEADKGLRVEK